MNSIESLKLIRKLTCNFNSKILGSGYPLNLDSKEGFINLDSKVSMIFDKYNNNHINIMGVISELKKVKTKINRLHGLKLTTQSTVNGGSMLYISLTKLESKEKLKLLVDILTKWDYSIGEYLENESVTLFGDRDLTIKQMKEDYKEAINNL